MSERQQETKTLTSEHLVPQDTKDLKSTKSKGTFNFPSTNKENSKSPSKSQLCHLLFEFQLSGHSDLLYELPTLSDFRNFFWCLFYYNFCGFFPMVVFAWQGQSWVVLTETIYSCDWLYDPQSLKYLLTGLLQKKFAYLMDWAIYKAQQQNHSLYL